MLLSSEEYLAELASATGDELLRLWARAQSNHAIDRITQDLEFAAHDALDRLGEFTGEDVLDSWYDGAVLGAAYVVVRRVLENPDDSYDVCRKFSGHFYSPHPLVAFICLRQFVDRLGRFSIYVSDHLIAIAAEKPSSFFPFPVTMRAMAFRALYHLDPQYKHWSQLTDARVECVRSLAEWGQWHGPSADENARLAQQMQRYTNLSLSTNNRRQASLYLSNTPHIESLRTRLNPAQAKLIPAHVTLIREDEVADWDELHQRLKGLVEIELTLQFGVPKRDGDLVYLPVVGGNEQFDQLRAALLPGTTPRKHNPHLTLIHPRNGICTDAIFDEIIDTVSAFEATFTTVRLIEQTDGGPWNRFA